MNELSRALVDTIANLLIHDRLEIALNLAQAVTKLPDGPISTATALGLLAGLANEFPTEVDVIYTCFTNSFQS